MDDLVARVAKAVHAASMPDASTADRERFWHETKACRYDQARAAIAEIFDYLKTPSEAAQMKGFVIGMLDHTEARDCWQAMLEQARREALGDG